MRTLVLLLLVGCGAEAASGKVTLHRWTYTCGDTVDEQEIITPVPVEAAVVTVWQSLPKSAVVFSGYSNEAGNIVVSCPVPGVINTIVWVDGPIIEEE